jgi:hypothetical protein
MTGHRTGAHFGRRRRRRRVTWSGVLILVVLVGTTVGSALLGTWRRSTTAVPAAALLRGPGPLLGILDFSGRYLAAERAAGVRVATIQVGWREVEPTPGTVDRAYLGSINALIREAASGGLLVVIDPGVQYPPAWVFGLGGGTRFVDQYGDAFTGPAASGDDVANAVTDPLVRSALGHYLTVLAAGLDLRDVAAVRQGGGPLGELGYPDADYAGHTNCFWAYDTSSRAASAALDYVPGTGTPAEAEAFLHRYNADLISYADWMNARYRSDFHRVTLLVLPGWGERPGVAALDEAHLLTLDYAEFNQGLDWPGLLASIPDRSDSIAYTTYLDAPSLGSSARTEDPASYLASLAGPLHMGLGGENTDSDARASLAVTLQRARALHLRIVSWFDEDNLVAAGANRLKGPTFADLGAAARRDLSA